MGKFSLHYRNKFISILFHGTALVCAVLLIAVFTGFAGESPGTLAAMAGKYIAIVKQPHLPDFPDFAGEPLPLENFDVQQGLDREFLVNGYWQSQTLLLLKRANRDFPVIEAILKKYGVPDDFKYLAVAESGLSNVVSPAKATGYWQILEATAREYGLEVNEEIDERYSIEKSTEVACQYFLDSYKLYKSWTMAAASYNMGRRGINRQIERQRTDYFYDLLLNEETSRYIYRLVALKTIMTHPEKYGFVLGPDELYPPYRFYEVQINSRVDDLAEFAIRLGTNYKMLKILNPWLRDNVLPNPTGKSYTLKLPEKGSRQYKWHLPDTSFTDSVVVVGT